MSLLPRHFEKLMLMEDRARTATPKCRMRRGGFVHRGTIIRAIREIMQNARALEHARQPRGLVDEGMQMIIPTRGLEPGFFRSLSIHVHSCGNSTCAMYNVFLNWWYNSRKGELTGGNI